MIAIFLCLLTKGNSHIFKTAIVYIDVPEVSCGLVLPNNVDTGVPVQLGFCRFMLSTCLLSALWLLDLTRLPSQTTSSRWQVDKEAIGLSRVLNIDQVLSHLNRPHKDILQQGNTVHTLPGSRRISSTPSRPYHALVVSLSESQSH